MKVKDGNDAINELVNSFDKEISRDYGFEMYGSGASFPVKIEWIKVCVQSQFVGVISKARQLVVPIALRLIERMNEDQNLRPYLANYPVTLKNIILRIAFIPENDMNFNPNNCLDSVVVIGLKEIIIYSILDEKKTMLVDLHRETFDEAMKILQQESE